MEVQARLLSYVPSLTGTVGLHFPFEKMNEERPKQEPTRFGQGIMCNMQCRLLLSSTGGGRPYPEPIPRFSSRGNEETCDGDTFAPIILVAKALRGFRLGIPLRCSNERHPNMLPAWVERVWVWG